MPSNLGVSQIVHVTLKTCSYIDFLFFKLSCYSPSSPTSAVIMVCDPFNPLPFTYLLSFIGSISILSMFVLSYFNYVIFILQSQQPLGNQQIMVQISEHSTASYPCKVGDSVSSVHILIFLFYYLVQRWRTRMPLF